MENEKEVKVYAVCKNGRCAQTYELDEIINGKEEELFMEEIKETNGWRCKKCGAVVVDTDGSAMLSGNPTIVKYVTVEQSERNKEEELAEALEEFENAKRNLERIKEEYGDTL